MKASLAKRMLALLFCLLMVVGLLPTEVLAASWQPSDTITITVDVFDHATNKLYENVGTDTVTKGNANIQSDNYKIPELSKFTTEKYGRVTEVTGNWYGVYSSCNVGTNVNFSCDSNTARITYWVTWYKAAGSGSNSNSDDTINYGDNGRNIWTQTIVYHANYPDGSDATHTVT